MKETILKCGVCGAVAEMIVDCQCYTGLECCGKPMQEEIAQTADSSKEKHVPVGQRTTEGSVKVVVGSTPHPMTDQHRILWIEIIDGEMKMRKYLKAGDSPEAVFPTELKPGMILREYCNIHGLWEYKA